MPTLKRPAGVLELVFALLVKWQNIGFVIRGREFDSLMGHQVMKKALILGCSHAAGSEMSKEPGMVFDDHAQATLYEQTHCYPAQIAQALGYHPVNQAIPGGSNDAMFRLFLEAKLSSQDMVIACWTGVNRSEIYNEQWIALAPGTVPDQVNADYFKQWLLYSANTEVGMLNKAKNILALNALAHAQGIWVININSFWPVTDITWPDSVSWSMPMDFMSWCQQHRFPHTAWGHFFRAAHDSYAEHVLANTAGRAVTTPVS